MEGEPPHPMLKCSCWLSSNRSCVERCETGCCRGWKRRVSGDVLEESGIGQTLGMIRYADKGKNVQEVQTTVEGSRMKR